VNSARKSFITLGRELKGSKEEKRRGEPNSQTWSLRTDGQTNRLTVIFVPKFESFEKKNDYSSHLNCENVVTQKMFSKIINGF